MCDDLELWLQFINAETEEDYERLKQTNNPDIMKAVDIIYEMSEDREVQEMVRLREKTLHDEASMIGAAKREGRAEREAEIIAKMKKSGLSDEMISSILNA